MRIQFKEPFSRIASLDFLCRGQVQTATAATTGLACFIFRFLRRPLAERYAPITSSNIMGP
ncbi:hypothetical protein B9N43_15220 [Denitratisoma sp. DHT3]|nr:hypothetical protein B9N43_15220 [Denitratisoma sp. DHT3]